MLHVSASDSNKYYYYYYYYFYAKPALEVQYKSAEFGNLVTKSSGGMYRGVNLLQLLFNLYILVKQG